MQNNQLTAPDKHRGKVNIRVQERVHPQPRYNLMWLGLRSEKYVNQSRVDVRQADALAPGGGNWVEIGRDYVWLSEGLALPTEIANDMEDGLADRQIAEGEFQ